MAREREQHEKEQAHWKNLHEQLKIETNAKMEANGEYLHQFYLNQMEEICAEKVRFFY